MAVKDKSGTTLAKWQIPDDLEGVRRFHELVGPFSEEPAEVLVGIETDRGLFVSAVRAAGHRVRPEGLK